MTVEEILELMDELLDKSSSVPFSQKKMIDVEQMREYIDSIRLNLPGEIKRAKDMTRDKKNILTEANKEAEEIVKKAKDEAKKLDFKVFGVYRIILGIAVIALSFVLF